MFSVFSFANGLVNLGNIVVIAGELWVLLAFLRSVLVDCFVQQRQCPVVLRFSRQRDGKFILGHRNSSFLISQYVSPQTQRLFEQFDRTVELPKIVVHAADGTHQRCLDGGPVSQLVPDPASAFFKNFARSNTGAACIARIRFSEYVFQECRNFQRRVPLFRNLAVLDTGTDYKHDQQQAKACRRGYGSHMPAQETRGPVVPGVRPCEYRVR